jgi:hypothetical protein
MVRPCKLEYDSLLDQEKWNDAFEILERGDFRKLGQIVACLRSALAVKRPNVPLSFVGRVSRYFIDGTRSAEDDFCLVFRACDYEWKFAPIDRLRTVVRIMMPGWKAQVAQRTIAEAAGDHLQSVWGRVLFKNGSGEFKKSFVKKLLKITSLSDLELRRNAEIKDLWARTKLFAQIATQSHLCDVGWRVQVHHLAQIPNCPTIILFFLLRLDPEGIRTRDEYGKIPLHHAVMNIPGPPPKYGNRHDFFKRKDYAGVGVADDVQKSMIDFLLDRFPAGASFVDNDGRLPISLALEANAPSESVIEPLIAAAPDALVTRDTKTRLWPFLLAAASEYYSLDDTLALVLRNPAVLMCRRKNEYELEVEQLMSRGIKFEKLQQEKLALEEKVEVLEEENASLKSQLNDREATIRHLEEELTSSGEEPSHKRTDVYEELEDVEQEEGRKKARIE